MVSQRKKAAPLALERRDYIDRPGVDAHAAWAEGAWPSVASAFASRPLEPFYSHAVSAQLDGLTVQFATGSARALTRDGERARTDGLAMLVVGILFDEPLEVEARGRPVRVPAGDLLLLDLAQAAGVMIPAGSSVQLAIPRIFAEAYLGPVRRLHGRVVPGDTATLFVEHLSSLREALATLDEEQAARLARVLMELLAVAIGRSAEPAGGASGPLAQRPATIRETAEAALVQPATTMALLCRQLGMSRSTLSRMFKADGGVETHRRNLRLAHVRETLLDPGNRELIAVLAERWGFSDASHLTRAFRRRYGTTPGAMRAEAVGRAGSSSCA